MNTLYKIALFSFLLWMMQYNFIFGEKIWIFFDSSQISLKNHQTSSKIKSILPYIDQIYTRSQLLNAISAEVNLNQIDQITQFYFVRKTEKVKKITRPIPVQSLKKYSSPDNQSAQITQIAVDALHQQGYHGEGITIGILDTGFDLDHEIFDSIKVLNKYDFINSDSIVSDQNADEITDNQADHGTKVLSVLAGYKKNIFISPAYRANFLLAKTEIRNEEIEIEEDYYVAGLEWCAENGASVISTSLGYSDFYTRGHLDGETSISAKAVNLLAQNYDVLIINSVGNDGNSQPSTLTTPADAQWALAVGSVDETGLISSFSSSGPNLNGIIKPDLLARGAQTWTVLYGSTNQYSQSNGTSYAAPLVAGACALIRQKNPEWDIQKIFEQIHQTSSRSDNPDFIYGYGILNSYAASIEDPVIRGKISYNNTLIDNAQINLLIDNSTSSVYSDINGYFFFNQTMQEAEITVVKSGYSTLNYSLTQSTQSPLNLELAVTDPEPVILYPNPAQTYFKIAFRIPTESYSLYIFNINGQLVYKQQKSSYSPIHEVSFHFSSAGQSYQSDESHFIENLGSGIYILKIETDQNKHNFKLMIK